MSEVTPSLPSMDIFLELGSLLSVVVLIFTVWMLVAGAVAARSPSWSVAMYDAAAEELVARGYQPRNMTVEQLRTINDVLGSKPAPVDPVVDARLIAALRSLTGAEETGLVELHARRDSTLERAIARRHRAVKRIASPWLFAKVWNLYGLINNVHSVVVGLTWFIPPFAARTRRIGERYLSAATFVGIWFGLLFWEFHQMGGKSTSADWTSIVGVVITAAGAVGFVAAVCKQICDVVTVWWGPWRTWTLKGVLLGLTGALLFTAAIIGALTGGIQSASLTISTWLSDEVKRLNATQILGMLFMLAVLGYLVYQCIALTRAAYLRISERITQGLVALILACGASLVLAFAFRAPRPWAIWNAYALALGVFSLAAYRAILAAVGAVRDWRYLKRLDVRIPKRGFRGWALVSWLTASAAQWTVAIAQSGNPAPWKMGPLGQFLELWLLFVSLVLALTFWPGAVVTVLYVLRISRVATSVRGGVVTS